MPLISSLGFSLFRSHGEAVEAVAASRLQPRELQAIIFNAIVCESAPIACNVWLPISARCEETLRLGFCSEITISANSSAEKVALEIWAPATVGRSSTYSNAVLENTESGDAEHVASTVVESDRPTISVQWKALDVPAQSFHGVSSSGQSFANQTAICRPELAVQQSLVDTLMPSRQLRTRDLSFTPNQMRSRKFSRET